MQWLNDKKPCNLMVILLNNIVVIFIKGSY